MEHLIFFLHLVFLFIGLSSVIFLWIGNTLWNIQLLQGMRLYWTCFSLLYAKYFIDSYLAVASNISIPMLPVILSIIGLILKLAIISISINIFILPLLRKSELYNRIKVFLPLGITFLLVVVAVIFQNSNIELYRVMNFILDYFLIIVLLLESIIFYIFYTKEKSRHEKTLVHACLSIFIFSSIGLFSLFHDQGLLKLNTFFEEFMIFPIYYLGWSIFIIVWFFKKNLKNTEKTYNPGISDKQLDRYSITNREKEVITLQISGKNRNEIAEELFISPRTVDNHIANIYRKCSVKNKIELIKKLTTTLPK